MLFTILAGGAAIATGITGLVKGAKGVQNTKEANRVQERAEDILASAKKKISLQKEETNKAIQELGKIKVEIWSEEIKDFVDIYSEIKNIE